MLSKMTVSHPRKECSSKWSTLKKAMVAFGLMAIIGVADLTLQIRSERRALVCHYCEPWCKRIESCWWCKRIPRESSSEPSVDTRKKFEAGNIIQLDSSSDAKNTGNTDFWHADAKCCPCCCKSVPCDKTNASHPVCKRCIRGGDCNDMFKKPCMCIDECYCANKLCCVATWCCSLWTAIGVLAMPLGHLFMYGGNKTCDCDPERCCNCDVYGCDVGKDWYTEETFKKWVAGGGESTGFTFDNPLSPNNAEEFTLEQIDLVKVQKTEEFEHLDLRNVDHQYAFKLMTGDVPEEERTPVIIAGGRGSDVSNLWDQKRGKVLDISDFPDSDKYVFYSMDYPGYGATNPQDAGKLPGYEDNILQDYKALFDYVKVAEQKKDVKPLLSGVSLGAGVIQGLAERIVDENTGKLNEEISGMMLINPFKTGKQATLGMFGGVPNIWYPFLSVIDEWDSASRMEKLAGEDVPTLIYSSIDDKVIKSSHHRELYEIAAGLEEGSTPAKLGATLAGEKNNKLLIQAKGGHKDLDLFGSDSKTDSGITIETLLHQDSGLAIANWFTDNKIILPA